jgi:hypothetical protein
LLACPGRKTEADDGGGDLCSFARGLCSSFVVLLVLVLVLGVDYEGKEKVKQRRERR